MTIACPECGTLEEIPRLLRREAAGAQALNITTTKVLRLIAEMGRWSKTDPFAIVFFVPLVHFGALGSESAGWGATAFMMMTFLTMVASVTVDPRLMWDVAGRAATRGGREAR